MKKITKILMTMAFLLTAVTVYPQQECAIICHNGNLVKAVGGNAIKGHLDHHPNDLLISTDCDYVIQGNECESLSVKEFQFNNYRELIGLNYTVIDFSGKELQKGIVDDYFLKNITAERPALIKIEGYKTKKYFKVKH